MALEEWHSKIAAVGVSNQQMSAEGSSFFPRSPPSHEIQNYLGCPQSRLVHGFFLGTEAKATINKHGKNKAAVED